MIARRIKGVWVYSLKKEGMCSPFFKKHIAKHSGDKAVEDPTVNKFLLDTIYDKNFKRTIMANYTKKDYLKFRETLIKKARNTVYFPELIWYLEEWNSLFGVS